MQRTSPLFLAAALVCLAVSVRAQLTIPQTSPAVAAQHDVAFTTVKIQYSSPSVMGREVWGKLVPYGDKDARPWRAGANNTTVIGFSEDVAVNGQPLPAGQYGLHMIPTKEEWTLIFSKKWEGWGSYDYDPAQDALRLQVQTESAPFRENLTYTFTDRTAGGMTVALEWEKLRVPFRIEIDLDQQVFQRIDAQLDKLGGDELPDALATAAYYCLANNVELERGLEYADKGIRYGKTYLLYAYKSDILLKLGREEEAKKARTMGYKTIMPEQLHQRALNNLGGRDVAGAREKFQYLLDTLPQAWYGYESKAHLLYLDGNAKDARLWLMKTRESAPEAERPRLEKLLEEWQKE